MHEHELQRNPLIKGQVLLVTTSCSSLASNGPETGSWLSEVATPYVAFVSKGFDVTIASPSGGRVPVDPASLKTPGGDEEDVAAFMANETAQQMMAASVPLDKVEGVKHYNAIVLTGGHGASGDFPTSMHLQRIVKDALANENVVVAAVCHGNAVFASEELGKELAGRKIACFSDEEERAVGRDAEVPFLLESRLKELGVQVITVKAGDENVVVEGNLVTGQNPASAKKLAEEVLRLMEQRRSQPTSPTAGRVSAVAASPGTMTAAQVTSALGVPPILAEQATAADPTVDESFNEDVVEPSMQDNLGVNAAPNPGTNAGNLSQASG